MHLNKENEGPLLFLIIFYLVNDDLLLILLYKYSVLYINITVTAYNVRSEDFDSTLIVCLLRNMTPRESAPVTGWDNLPLPGDASKGADLARIKWYRNMVAHHGDGKLSPTEFSQYWADLEGVSKKAHHNICHVF